MQSFGDKHNKEDQPMDAVNKAIKVYHNYYEIFFESIRSK